MRVWLMELIEWPGNIRLRTFLVIVAVAVMHDSPDVVGLMLWAIWAVAAVNLASWLFGPRRRSGSEVPIQADL